MDQEPEVRRLLCFRHRMKDRPLDALCYMTLTFLVMTALQLLRDGVFSDLDVRRLAFDDTSAVP